MLLRRLVPHSRGRRFATLATCVAGLSTTFRSPKTAAYALVRAHGGLGRARATPRRASSRPSLPAFVSSPAVSTAHQTGTHDSSRRSAVVLEEDAESRSAALDDDAVLPSIRQPGLFGGRSSGKKSGRMRHHLNPLSPLAVRPAELEKDWVVHAFRDAQRPTTFDVGCALGGWCLESAARDPARNFLGLEIRPAAVEAAWRRWAKAGRPTNAAYVKANANVDLARLLEDADRAGATVDRILFMFPDPHFKKKHKKRRVVTPDVARLVADHLENLEAQHDQRQQQQQQQPKRTPPFVYLVSDVLDVAEDMRQVFRDAAPGLHELSWLDESPLTVRTERERAVLAARSRSTSTEPGHCFRAVFYAGPADRAAHLDDVDPSSFFPPLKPA